MTRKIGLRKATFLKFTAVIAFVLLIASCKKGDTGPAGTANVTYSDWFTASPWTKDTVFSIYGFYYNKAYSEITQNIVDSGTVLTFGKLLGYNPAIWPTNQVAQLPISLTYVQGSTMTDTWSSLVTPGNVKIQFVNDKNYYGSIATSHQFRVIIIPGGKSITASTGSTVYTRDGRALGADTYNANIQLVAKNYPKMSYAEICDRLGIPQ